MYPSLDRSASAAQASYCAGRKIDSETSYQGMQATEDALATGMHTALHTAGGVTVQPCSIELLLSPVDGGYHEGPGEVVHRGLRRFRVENPVECKRLFQRATGYGHGYMHGEALRHYSGTLRSYASVDAPVTLGYSALFLFCVDTPYGIVVTVLEKHAYVCHHGFERSG